jgi:hypothetical protein
MDIRATRSVEPMFLMGVPFTGPATQLADGATAEDQQSCERIWNPTAILVDQNNPESFH